MTLFYRNVSPMTIGLNGRIFSPDLILNEPYFSGGLATTGFLVAGLYAVISRNSRMQQYMMRGRVVAQGITFGAIGMGVGLALKQNFEKKRAVTTRIPAESPNET